jgi:hypothetical protein
VTAAFFVKLIVTPAFVGLASLVARRWGSQVGGWLVGFPFTSAPIALIFLLEHGGRFAASAALASMLGVLSQAAYAFVYATGARRLHPAVCVSSATAVFFAVTIALSRILLAPPWAVALIGAGLSLVLVSMPRVTRPSERVDWPAWDLPLRMFVATLFVVALTTVAGLLGPRLSGLLTPFPLYATVLAIFAHVQLGPAAAGAVMRGLVTGLYGFAAFFLVLGLVVAENATAAFGLAVVAVFLVQAIAISTESISRRTKT